jgi:hypothetical protein
MCLQQIVSSRFHFHKNDYNISSADLPLFLRCLLVPVCCRRIFPSNIQMGLTTLYSRNPHLRARPLSSTDYRRISSHSTWKTWELDQRNCPVGCVTSIDCAFSAGGFVLVGHPTIWKLCKNYSNNIFICWQLTLAKLRAASGNNCMRDSNWDTFVNIHHLHNQNHVCIDTTFPLNHNYKTNIQTFVLWSVLHQTIIIF